MKCPCEGPKRTKRCQTGTPPVLEVHSKECPVLFHTVNIPASVGTVETLPPTPGAYRNARVTYEADEVSYLYDSDGIPQLLSNGGGAGAVESVNGKTGVVVLDANDVGAATTADLATKQDVLTAGANITINDNEISATDTTYTAGTNIDITGNVISATDTTYIAGTGLTLTSGEFAVDTTTIATKQYVDDIVGNIESALNIINNGGNS